MTDNKNPESDGFQELEAGIDPLTVNLLSVNKSPEKKAIIDKEKSADKVTMKEKLRSVFGNDIRFDEPQSKSARPHHDSDKLDVEPKNQKEKNCRSFSRKLAGRSIQRDQKPTMPPFNKRW